MQKNDKIQIIKKDGGYFMLCDLSEEPIYLCRANDLNSLFVMDDAEWEYSRLETQRRFEKWENSVTT